MRESLSENGAMPEEGEIRDGERGRDGGLPEPLNLWIKLSLRLGLP